ncbi:hypothetical protein P9112_006807 [Eukaryota sp. TZLM1-RC]
MLHAVFFLSTRGGNILYHRQFSPNYGLPISSSKHTAESVAAILYILSSKSCDILPQSSPKLVSLDSHVSLHFCYSNNHGITCACISTPTLSHHVLPSSLFPSTPSPLSFITSSLLSAFKTRFASELSFPNRTSGTPGATPRLTSSGKTFSNFVPAIIQSSIDLLLVVSRSLCSLFSSTRSSCPWIFVCSLTHTTNDGAGKVCYFSDEEGLVLPEYGAEISSSLISFCLNVLDLIKNSSNNEYFSSEMILPKTGHCVSIGLYNRIIVACPVSLNEFKEVFKHGSADCFLNWLEFCISNKIDLLVDFE